MAETLTLPILPLRNLVLFPGVSVPITAGRPGTVKAIEEALKSPGRRVLALTQRTEGDSVSAEDLYTIGTIASIGSVQRSFGSTQLVLNGLQRGIPMKIAQRGGMLEAVLVPGTEMPPLDPKNAAFVGLHKEARERAAELGRKLGLPDQVVDQILSEVKDPGRLADIVASYLEMPLAERQLLLEALSVEDRLRRVLVHVERQIGVLDAQEQIKSKVQEELGDRQREMFLREQLKAIQNELGEGEGKNEGLDALEKKLDGLKVSDEVRREIDREWARLSRMGREAMEAQVVRTYLEWVSELPWSERSDDHLDVAAASRILDEDHHGLADVKDRILEFLAVRQLLVDKKHEGEAAGKGRILLFVGPPGVGKTSIAKSIARAMGRKYVRISLGGARDEADIRGHRRTYVGALPGRILQGMKQAGTKNPVFLLDEIDKLGVSFQGDPASALLEVLDPAQNDSFTDHYLGVPFDLSEVLFIATANFVQSIPTPLLDRLEVVEFTGYTEREKLQIARKYLVPRQLTENGLTADELKIEDEALAEVTASYTRESGVRQLNREIGKLARKVARRIAAKEIISAVLSRPDVSPLLGRPKVHPEKKETEDRVGIATGMYYTPAGGDIMFVEAALMRGKGGVQLTGQLGDVMKESAHAAFTYARSHALPLHIGEEALDRDLHIHVPAGAIPKDGPSAGIAMATAVVSALSGRPARHDVAMTGEITISGRVLPIGGVKEKVLGAVRAGISAIVLPRENEPDLADLPEDVRRQLDVHPVSELGEALAFTLRGGHFSGGELTFGAGDGTAPH